MSFRRHACAAVIMLHVVTGGISYADAPPNTDTLIDEAMDLSGLRQQLGDFQNHFQAKDLPPELPLTQRETLGRIFREAFRPAALDGYVKNHLRRQITDNRISLLVDQLRTPLMRKMAQLEVQASAAAAESEKEQFAQRLLSVPPDPQRLKLVQRLDDVAGGSQAATEVVISMMRIIANASSKMARPEQRPGPNEINTMIEQLRPRLSTAIQQRTLLTNLFAYRSIADAELLRYIEFHETPLGQWYVEIVKAALLDAMTKASEEAGKEIGKLSPPDPKQPGPT
jgi:hypothetical protein